MTAVLAGGRGEGVQQAQVPVTAGALAAVRELAHRERLPAYVYDLAHLGRHVAGIRTALAASGARIELLHAVKANPEPALLATIARHADGLEVASGGELAHVRAHLPHVPLAFGGPGKTDTELAAGLAAGVDRFHVESRHELRRLDALARAADRVASVLLRVNLPHETGTGAAALAMGGTAGPFGMDPEEADLAAAELGSLAGVRPRGVHAHLASGLGPAECARLAGEVLVWARAFAARHGWELHEVNVGGGMGVDYQRPGEIFGWAEYAQHLAGLVGVDGRLTLRIEPGRAVSAYSGWYATRVLDLKRSQGGWFAVCAGGTHHLRTPAAKGHDQPLVVLPSSGWSYPWPRPRTEGERVTFVGQLCTPKDVLARNVAVPRIAAGDIVVFAMAGAYAYNISHHDFLMHPPPTVVCVP